MKNKIALIGFSLALLINVGCSSTKSTQKNTSAPTGDGKTTVNSTTNNAISDNNAALPPVAEAPRGKPWGGNIGLYGY
ncbi:MAG: hypothetical protein WCD79_09030 [Chthoniobacteraceae bacterium]